MALLVQRPLLGSDLKIIWAYGRKNLEDTSEVHGVFCTTRGVSFLADSAILRLGSRFFACAMWSDYGDSVKVFYPFYDNQKQQKAWCEFAKNHVIYNINVVFGIIKRFVCLVFLWFLVPMV